MPNLRGSEWLIIILLLVLLFGAKRLPDAARSMGRSLRIFKAETKGLVDDGTPADHAPAASAQQAPAAPIAPPQPTTAPAVPPAPPQVAAPSDDQRVGGSLTPQPPTQA